MGGVSSKRICESLQRSGAASIGYGTVRTKRGRRQVIRLVTVNPEVTRAEIERLFDDVATAAEEIRVSEGVRVSES